MMRVIAGSQTRKLNEFALYSSLVGGPAPLRVATPWLRLCTGLIFQTVFV